MHAQHGENLCFCSLITLIKPDWSIFLPQFRLLPKQALCRDIRGQSQTECITLFSRSSLVPGTW